jgi:tol-pal system protein YbgF
MATTFGAEATEAPHEAEREALSAEVSRRERRIRELESRLALAHAEVRDLRNEVEQRAEAARAREVVRIGDRPAPPAREPVEAVEPEEDSGPRPVLRLYGAPTSAPLAAYQPGASDLGIARPMPAASLPAYLQAPPMALGRLPVSESSGSAGVPPIPDQPLTVVPGAPTAPLLAPSVTSSVTSSVTPRPPGSDPVVRQYQAALQHVAGRRFGEALGALDAFLRDHPQHPYADNAMYWRAEVLYAQRDYVGAERELLELLRRFPRGNKVPDALLRLGFCRERQGDVEGARAYFRRVRAEHPGTVAARLASREDT